MIAQLHGIVVAFNTSGAVIEVGGVGFRLGMSTMSLAALGALQTEVTVYTTLIVRQDALDLYGFMTPAERDLFERLITVSGIGPKVAISALSTFTSDVLQQLIIDEDVKRLTTISGLGKKTAQRLILDLRGTLVATEDDSLENLGQINPIATQVNEALSKMGFTRSEIETALQGYQAAGTVEDAGEWLRYALQRLGSPS